MNLLVIDWDYFFPVPEPGKPERVLYDWGHTELGAQRLFLQDIWPHRAGAFVATGLGLPGASPEYMTFWQRFQIARRATLYVAESNSQAASARVAANVTSVWLYDAHHDSGYRGSDGLREAMQRGFTAEDWMAYYYLNGVIDLHVRYPRWKGYAFEDEPTAGIPVDRAIDDGLPVPVQFDRVFVCRSGVWVPSWVDAEFEAFVGSAGIARLRYVPDTERVVPRPFDRDTVVEVAQALMGAKQQPEEVPGAE